MRGPEGGPILSSGRLLWHVEAFHLAGFDIAAQTKGDIQGKNRTDFLLFVEWKEDFLSSRLVLKILYCNGPKERASAKVHTV